MFCTGIEILDYPQHDSIKRRDPLHRTHPENAVTKFKELFFLGF